MKRTAIIPVILIPAILIAAASFAVAFCGTAAASPDEGFPWKGIAINGEPAPISGNGSARQQGGAKRPVGRFGGPRRIVAQQVGVKLEKDLVKVFVDQKLFTCYKFAADQKYPYFWPVAGPRSGLSITTETSEPYPHHHSLFFGCDRVNGGNYWQEGNERGQIVSKGPRITEATGNRVVIEDECLWRQPGQEPIMADRRLITITAPGPDFRLIDFEITLEPLTKVTILKTNHALFSARVMPELSVKSGGTLVNAQGQSGEKETFGVPSPWCDYSGTRDGITEGIAILTHPKNRWHPCPWFTRDYGFFSPTPMYWLEGDRLELPEGKPITLRYRVAVHGGDAGEAKIEECFEQYGGK